MLYLLAVPARVRTGASAIGDMCTNKFNKLNTRFVAQMTKVNGRAADENQCVTGSTPVIAPHLRHALLESLRAGVRLP